MRATHEGWPFRVSRFLIIPQINHSIKLQFDAKSSSFDVLDKRSSERTRVLVTFT